MVMVSSQVLYVNNTCMVFPQNKRIYRYIELYSIAKSREIVGIFEKTELVTCY